MAEKTQFSGEDENAGFASPVQDLIAAGFLILLSLWIMVESVRLENPGSLSTAPGLLPFLTAGSLVIMALGLGLMALKRHRAGETQAPPEDAPELMRTLMLFAMIGAYLGCLQLVSFEYHLQVGTIRLGYGAFEVLTIVVLTVLLANFWRQALWACLLISFVWVTFLAGVFRYVFTIPLPGSI